jgi:hypothetical protein
MNIVPAITRVIDIMNLIAKFKWMRRFAVIAFCAMPVLATAAEQQLFATPEAAVDALFAALKADDDAALAAIFGDKHKALIITPDRTANTANRAKAVRRDADVSPPRRAGEGSARAADRRSGVAAADSLVRAGQQWRFATEEGEDELVNRRVGANERSAIRVMRAYLDAQKDYASRDRDGDGVLQYAQRLGSTPGKHDGLYWPSDAAKGEEASPFGPLVAESAAYLKGHKAGEPYRGYHFRILTRQGASAPGGAYNYVINGRMIAGFAMVAYPAQFGESGVMTFIVSHNGKVFEKDLGKNSAEIGAKMTAFDPGAGWKEVAAQ